MGVQLKQTDAQWQQRNESTENEVGVTFVLCITRVIHARARPSYTKHARPKAQTQEKPGNFVEFQFQLRAQTCEACFLL